jgi:hypothetical protein
MCYEELDFSHSVSKHDGVFGGTVLGFLFQKIEMHHVDLFIYCFCGVMLSVRLIWVSSAHD